MKKITKILTLILLIIVCSSFVTAIAFFDLWDVGKPEIDEWYEVAEWEKVVCTTFGAPVNPELKKASDNAHYIIGTTFTLNARRTNFSNTDESLYEVSFYLQDTLEQVPFKLYLRNSIEGTEYPILEDKEHADSATGSSDYFAFYLNDSQYVKPFDKVVLEMDLSYRETSLKYQVDIIEKQEAFKES